MNTQFRTNENQITNELKHISNELKNISNKLDNKINELDNKINELDNKINKLDNKINEEKVYGFNQKTEEWHCLSCGISMGANNPRQFCKKTYCENLID